jgi:hypothetical protein
MCFGGTKAPQIVYTGPSAEDVAAQRQQLEVYQQQSAAQQQQFAQSLQQQIEQANRQAEEQRKQLEQEQQLAMSELSAQQQGAYAASATLSEPVSAQVTEAIQPKKKPKASLKIAQGSMVTTEGAGLNIGV